MGEYVNEHFLKWIMKWNADQMTDSRSKWVSELKINE